MKRVIALLSIATISSAGIIPTDFSYYNYPADDIFSNYNPFWCWNSSFSFTYFGNCDSGITNVGTSAVGDIFEGDQVIFSIDQPYVEGQIVGSLLEVKFGKLFLEGDILISERDKYEILNLYEGTTNFSTLPAGLGFGTGTLPGRGEGTGTLPLGGDGIGTVQGGGDNAIGTLPDVGERPTRPAPRPARQKRSLIVRITGYASFNDGLNNEEHNINKRSIVWKQYQKWKKVGNLYPVPYYIDRSIDKDSTMRNFGRAVSAIESISQIRFNSLTQPTGDYVHVESKPGHGCYSQLGRQGGKQELILENFNCNFVGKIIHELLHAVGFLHEQSRSDRNDFVTILRGNIESNKENNFKKRKKSLSLGSPYDYQSVMHYPLDAFAMLPNLKTLKLKTPVSDPSTIGGKTAMSQEDINQLNAAYN